MQYNTYMNAQSLTGQKPSGDKTICSKVLTKKSSSVAVEDKKQYEN